MPHTMTFGDYEFSYNPESIKISAQRNSKLYCTPSKKYIFHDLGNPPLIVSGEGCFIGDEAVADYFNLYAELLSASSADLLIPGFAPSAYYFLSLDAVLSGKNNAIKYTFKFLKA